MSTGTANHSEHGSEPNKQSLTAEEASRRIAALRRVYHEGYISEATLETMLRNIRAHVKRNR